MTAQNLIRYITEECQFFKNSREGLNDDNNILVRELLLLSLIFNYKLYYRKEIKVQRKQKHPTQPMESKRKIK